MAFQPQIGIIAHTLMGIIEPAWLLVLIIVVVGLMFSIATNVILGWYIQGVSTIQLAIEDTFLCMVGGGIFDPGNMVVVSGGGGLPVWMASQHAKGCAWGV